ncbi:SPFH domain-containing protein [Pseudobdellovibrio sp. HCB154]|uniref:SPFH domain-containing protein n=1 Tax=Pseudobdellovibrio sp. HCB154 TaxID=3386277 RepID=UPI003917238F
MFETLSFSTIIIALIVLSFVGGLFVTVNQGTVSVVTMFGKYRRIMYPGLNFKIPFFEVIFRRVSIQNQSVELQFQAITQDQANVNFKALLLYAVIDQTEATIKDVAFKFIDFGSLMQTLNRTVEGSVRGFVATKRQNEILGLRKDIVNAVKAQLDEDLKSWGYHLIDMQLNDITFDETIMQSMAQVVASSNLRAAAENEALALLIKKTKAAEADGMAIKISAEAEKEASKLRGEGIALFREEVAKGMAKAADEMKNAGLDSSFILFSMWTDAIKHFAENGKGNTIFLDGSTDGLEKTMKQMTSLSQVKTGRA